MATASVALDAATEILMPGSEDEAIAAFGDGTDVVVVGGGTIVVPEMTYRRLQPAKALMLGSAGLAGITRDGSRVTIGATTPVEELVGMPAPLGPCASNIADLEIRSQATVGGNLCAGDGNEAPRGDLQGAFLALGATVRSAGDGGVTDEPLEDFLPKRARATSARRLLRRAGSRRVFGTRPPPHARLHRTRRIRSAIGGRHDPARCHGCRVARRSPSFG